jgi:uncharacterized MAPEG superfamily protein
MALVHIVLAIAVIQFFVFGALVGRARAKYGVEAPAMTGNELFERRVRVHYNTLEQLVVFIPAMLLFAAYVSTTAAAALGLVYVVGRILYFRAYVADPKKRGPGFGLSVLPTMVMLLGGLGGAVVAAL